MSPRPLMDMTRSSSQRGMATTVVMLLTGMAITVTAMGMMYGVRSAQEQLMVSHATVSAESKAWSAVELVRLYLKDTASADLSALKVGQMVSTSIADLQIKVSLPYNASTGMIGFTVSAITNRGGASASSATVEAIYVVGAAGQSLLASTIALSKATNMSGSINFIGAQNARFSVDGDVNLGGSVSGISYIEANGDIVIGGGIQVGEVFANKSLTVNGSASTTKGSAITGIKIASGGTQGTLKTNGNVSMENGAAGEINAIGNVPITGGGVRVNYVNSGGTVTCPGTWWSSYTFINARGTSGCPTANVSNQVPASTLVALTPITVKTVKIDANDYKSSANYIFEYVGGKIRVTVSGINGITDGIFYLGKYGWQNNRGYNDFLCAAVDASGNCTVPALPTSVRTICEGQSTSNGCISYSNGLWKVSGKSLAPGVLWFDGNLSMENGNYYNTVVATGNIATTGSHKIWSLNFAGYGVICENSYPSDYKTNDFAGMYPLAFCDKSGTKLKSNALGNIAYMSGAYNGAVFSGGTIKEGASSEIFGTIMAGDVFLTDGSSTVHGYINAAGQGSAGNNDWKGSTTIDLSNLPSTYNPAETPSAGGSSGNSGAQTATVKWTRYL